eukprot:CAMPEP_0179191092 /NCGR_PEP_ID=MMETSP0796-20121207/94907_1 /TAXON_ID=73915 /ORGANISM="Pyrodinium bahamense, Strain pbaha01" /LENGTH=126 /DNA_ID=CAMNT_0020895303 /DNA_START=163 /DNA_END=543 /DNA_ORIENTATION=+
MSCLQAEADLPRNVASTVVAGGRMRSPCGKQDGGARARKREASGGTQERRGAQSPRASGALRSRQRQLLRRQVPVAGHLCWGTTEAAKVTDAILDLCYVLGECMLVPVPSRARIRRFREPAGGLPV